MPVHRSRLTSIFKLSQIEQDYDPDFDYDKYINWK